MSSLTDPTMDFIHRLDDPSLWVVVHNVPVCIPHERTVTNEDGEETVIRVTEADLPEIAQQLQSREQLYGVFPVLTIGHRQQADPKFKETDQPPIVGITRNHTIGTFGPSKIPSINATVYYSRASWEEAKKYPFRSMDFYPGSKKVTGVALLKRDPYLPMGMVSYRSDEKPVMTSPIRSRIGFVYSSALGRYVAYSDWDESKHKRAADGKFGSGGGGGAKKDDDKKDGKEGAKEGAKEGGKVTDGKSAEKPESAGSSVADVVDKHSGAVQELAKEPKKIMVLIDAINERVDQIPPEEKEAWLKRADVINGEWYDQVGKEYVDSLSDDEYAEWQKVQSKFDDERWAKASPTSATPGEKASPEKPKSKINSFIKGAAILGGAVLAANAAVYVAAHLLQDDLTPVTYDQDDRPSFTYDAAAGQYMPTSSIRVSSKPMPAKGASMTPNAKPKKPASYAAAPPPDAAAGAPEDAAPEGHDVWSKHLDYAMKKHPVLMAACKQYMPEAGAEDAEGAGGLDELLAGLGGGAEGGGAAPPPPPKMPKPGEQNAAGEQDPNAAPGNKEEGLLGSLGLQNNRSPVMYQLLKKMDEFGKALNEKDRKIASLETTNSRRETEMIMYQLGAAGVKALEDPKKAAAIKTKLEGMTPAGRAQYAREIAQFWEKDEMVAFAHQGAPVGQQMFQVAGGADQPLPLPAGERAFTETHLEKAEAYMKKHPGCSWDEAEQYALTGKGK